MKAETVNFEEVKSMDDRKVFLLVTALEAIFVASFLFLYHL
ncbi:MAG: hypothetical protein ACPGJS_03960 [Flammeovirgaceae bacterium]